MTEQRQTPGDEMRSKQMMNGSGILKGLGVTLKHLLETYLEDIREGRKRYYTEEGIESRKSSDTRGIFTVNYPEERVPVPEEFRFVPILLYDVGDDGEIKHRCTACGICVQACPSQCIWIKRAVDPESGRSLSEAEEFYIDIDLCMNCGLCAEFCPFDCIKMDHDYELAVYDRCENNLYDLRKLSKPYSYYAEIRPQTAARKRLRKKRQPKRNPSAGGADAQEGATIDRC